MCQLCNQRDATVHFTRIINNQKVEMFVCEECAKQNEQLKLSLNKLLSGIMGIDFNAEYTGEATGMACPECGMTMDEFNKTGKMGCSTCYTTFRSSLEMLLKRIHGNVKHNGKMPGKLSAIFETNREINSLKQSLQSCIEMEEYEQAAELRDRIRKLERKPVDS